MKKTQLMILRGVEGEAQYCVFVHNNSSAKEIGVTAHFIVTRSFCLNGAKYHSL